MSSRIVASLSLFAAFLLGLLSFHPIAKAVERFTVLSCNSSSACAGGVNSQTGTGVTGGSRQGNGVFGWTQFPSTSHAKSKAGLFGQDLSTSGSYDVGVAGSATRGTGVQGTSTSGAGVVGRSTSSNGIVGQTSMTGGTSGVLGQDLSTDLNSNNSGVSGSSQSGYGVNGMASGNGEGVYAFSKGGIGLEAESDGPNPYPALGLVTGKSFTPLIVGNTSNGNYFEVDADANLTISGHLYTAGSCSSGCLKRRVQSYGMTAAVPTIEDNGKAQLLGGVVSVHLDAAFANAIDPRQGYIVQITPEGDTRGLYVASRTPAGFVVRETMGGRASIPFAYRVVAHPYGVHAARLPFVDTRTLPEKRRQVGILRRRVE
jgi:hypothetical protein